MRREFEFVAERVGEEVMRRGSGFVAGNSYQLGGIVFNRGHHLFLFLVPPLVGDDAVAVAVSTGEEGGVAGSGARVGVVVIAVGKICAVVEKEAEAGVAELVAIAFEVVAAKLVDDDDDYQLGMSVVG